MRGVMSRLSGDWFSGAPVKGSRSLRSTMQTWRHCFFRKPPCATAIQAGVGCFAGALLLLGVRIWCVLALLIAVWPVWRWYLLRMTDGSDEPCGWLALLTAAALALKNRTTYLRKDTVLVWPTFMLGVYVTAYAFVPPLVRGLLAIAALGSILLRGRGAAGLWGLLVLSLPIVATLQFYAGFPLRLLAAEASAFTVRACGFEVVREGSLLIWRGETIMVDAPCSGVHMLWFGAFLACTFATLYRLSALRTLLTVMTAIGVVISANMGRASILFFKEARIVTLPDWTHAGIGVAVFAVASFAIAAVARQMQRREKWSDESARPQSILQTSGPSRLLGHPYPCVSDRIAALCFLTLCGSAAVLPLAQTKSVSPATSFPGWPARFEGTEIHEIPLTAREAKLNAAFPGKIGKFTDGQRELILRWVTAGTRKLHSSADCFRGLGYTVTPQPALLDSQGARWSCFLAVHSGRRLCVRERITDEHGGEWTDVSAWFWSVLLRKTAGPWLAVTLVENASDSPR